MSIKKVGPVIDGKEMEAAGGGSVDVINPATGEVIAEELCCDKNDVDKIVQSSNNAFHSAEWQNLTAAQRGHLLYKLADLIEEYADELIELELLDTGKPITQLRTAEIPLTVDILRFNGGAADKIEGKVKTTANGSFQLTMYEPYGVVAGILPWNYPLVNVAMKAAPALAAGNSIIIKPSVETPLTAVAFAKLCVEAGIPAGIVNVVLGKGSLSGQALIEHLKVKKISFTGSTAIGQNVQKTAVEHMKAVNLELGGKNAVIVFADADLRKAANAAVMSEFINAGQLCVSCSRLLVEESVAEEFGELLKEIAGRVKVGDPREEDTLVGPMITKSQYDTALRYLDIAREEGCSFLTGGDKLELDGKLKNGFWVEPTIVTNVKPHSRVAMEEIFAPNLSVLTFKDEEEAVKISNSVEYGLSGSVWTKDGQRAMRMVKALDTGIIWVNTMFSGYPQISVPPHKMSGTGVELGMEGLMAYCKQKSAVMSYNKDEIAGWGL